MNNIEFCSNFGEQNNMKISVFKEFENTQSYLNLSNSSIKSTTSLSSYLNYFILCSYSQRRTTLYSIDSPRDYGIAAYVEHNFKYINQKNRTNF